VQTISPVLAEGLLLPEHGNVIIADVTPYSPADKAGLRIGDIILTLDNKRMENGRQFIVNVYGKPIGQPVLIEIQRGEVKKTVRVEVADRPDDQKSFIDMVSPQQNLVVALGLLGLDLDDRIRQMLPPLRIDSGVVVANRANLLYDQDALLPGDVIHFINSTPIKSLDDLREITGTLSAYDPVVVQVERFGEFRYVAFEME
jgi:serine protease Do